MSSSAPDTPTSPESAHAPLGGATLWTGWAAAACFALATAYFGAHYFAVRGQLTLASTDADFARTESQALSQRLEAERILHASYNAHLQKAADPATLKTARLTATPLAKEVSAFALWNPLSGDGLLITEKLPPPSAGENYYVWLQASPETEPVNAGKIAIDVEGRARTTFRAPSAAGTMTVFITQESEQSEKREGPIIAAGVL